MLGKMVYVPTVQTTAMVGIALVSSDDEEEKTNNAY